MHKSYSQSLQDRYALLVNPTGGFFIDIGCSIPEFQSNSKLLLEMGWRGVCIDLEDRHAEWSQYTGAKFINAQAELVPWDDLVQQGITPAHVSYASIDVDFYSYKAVENFILRGMVANCITLEHDSYRFSHSMRDMQRELMSKNGYIRVVSDVKSNGMEFEDWYLYQGNPNMEGIANEVQKWHLL